MSVAFSSYVVDAHAKEVSEVYSELNTSSEGLSESEASKRLLQNGPNELRKHEAETMTQKFMEQFKEPLILLLLCSALISMIMGEVADAIGIFIAVCIVNFVGIYQEYKSEKSVEALKSLTAHSCTVVRAREIKEVDAKSIVVGDIVVLNIGDRSPADLRLTETVSFQMAESLLTGEPEPVSKNSKAIIPGSSGSSSSKSSDDDDDDNDKDEDNDPRAHSQNHQRMANMSKAKKNIAYMGTTCANGRATGVVVAVGDQTELGKISLQMQSIKAGKSPLQRKMKEIGKQLSMLAFGIVAVIFIVGAIQQKNLLEMFTIGVSLAVAAIPEGLPIVVTVTLALGVTRMASRKAIVRKLPAVEALGATTVICTDKTGTLTQNVMTVTRVFTTEVFDVSNPPSLSASASHHHHHQQQSLHDVSVHVSDSNAFYFGHESDCSPIFYRRRQFEEKSSLNPLKDPLLYELLKASLICNNAQFNGTELVGQPTEGALLSLALKTGMKDLRITNQRLSEQPFSSETKMMSVEYDLTSGDDEGRCFFVKGAVERVLDSCAFFLDEGQHTVALDNSKRSEILQTFREFGNDALRVLAIAKGQSKDRMTFLGLVGLVDPPKIGVKDAIKKSQESGVHVVMVTGDGRDTAVAVARELGIKSYRYFVSNIKSSAQRSLLGTGSSSSASKFSVPRSSSSSSSSDGMKRKDSSDALFFRANEEEDDENQQDGIIALSSYDMENMSKDQLADIVDDVAVFYRVTPQNKVDIVEAFKRKGHIVAMTGDGVNDAPALKIADIGIAMGIAGTDVSKEAAEMILVDDNFSTIIAAIEEGKGIYNNIKNFLRFQLTTSIATLSIVAASTLFGLPLPLNPIQILWINIIMDGPPAQSLGVEPLDDDVMKRPPRDVNAPIFTPEMIFCILTSASIMVLGTLGTFYYELLFHPDEFGAAEKRAITVSFTTFVFFQMFNALNCRSDTKSVTQIGFMRNKFFVVAIGLSALMQLAAIYVPLLQMLFETVAITPHDILYSVSVASSVLIFEEVRKLYIRRSLHSRSRSSSSRPYSV